MTQSLVVLGVTGSIGRQALEVADRLAIPVVGVAAGTVSNELLALARRLPGARVVAARDDGDANELRAAAGARAAVGAEALDELAAMPGCVVVNGIVGAAGLAPSVAALAAGNRLALANKETMVAGGPVVLAALRSGGGELIPVDSEHAALWQCLVGEDRATVRRLVLTASGGPFRGVRPDDLADVTVEAALAHPTWKMGRRITIDSATLMNKALEVIEAHYLFGVAYSAIDVVVHPQSIVHSMVEFVDGSVKAQLGDPDMRIPIQYAITYPQRLAPVVPAGLDLFSRPLTFEQPDRETFPCLDLGYAAGRAGGTAPAVLNAADEVAVAAFLDGRLSFAAIAEVVAATLAELPAGEPSTVGEVLEADAAARQFAAGLVESRSGG